MCERCRIAQGCVGVAEYATGVIAQRCNEVLCSEVGAIISPYIQYCVRPQSSIPEEGPPPYQIRQVLLDRPIYIPQSLLCYITPPPPPPPPGFVAMGGGGPECHPIPMAHHKLPKKLLNPTAQNGLPAVPRDFYPDQDYRGLLCTFTMGRGQEKHNAGSHNTMIRGPILPGQDHVSALTNP